MSGLAETPVVVPAASRTKRWRRWRWLMLVAVIATAAAAMFGCISTVRSPLDPDDPLSVFLVSDDRHRGLVLPRSEGGFVEYGYGDWDWYARMEDSWYHVFDTVLWPTRGTLGRQELPQADGDALRRRFPRLEIHELRVSRTLALEVAARLDREFRSRIDEAVYNGRYRMTFVPHRDGYWCFFNCNDAVAEWLRELGCEVSWVPLRLGMSVR